MKPTDIRTPQKIQHLRREIASIGPFWTTEGFSVIAPFGVGFEFKSSNDPLRIRIGLGLRGGHDQSRA